MNKNVLIVLAGGFLVAILVAVLVNASLSGSKSKPATASGEDAVFTEVLVASKDLAIGRDVSSSDMKWQSWPENALFPGAIIREGEEAAEDIVSGRLSQPVAEGQPLLRAYFVKESQGNFMAAVLAPGMRAVGVSVKAETMAGGFIGPGDYVDVILTYTVRIRDRENIQIMNTISEFASETLIENVRVLAVDQKSQRDEDKANVGRTVTLEVTSAQAEQLALASEMGDITLSMRSLGDKKSVADGNMTTDVKSTKILKNLAKIQSSGSGAAGIVRVYNGQEVENVTVRQQMKIEE